MVLLFWQYPVSESELVRVLGTRYFGTPGPNIRRLQDIGFSVVYEAGTLSALVSLIGSGTPGIVFVRTGDLTDWTEDTAHALVLIGVDDTAAIVNDPAMNTAPHLIPIDEFMLA
jgi:hypothetical protein